MIPPLSRRTSLEDPHQIDSHCAVLGPLLTRLRSGRAVLGRVRVAVRRAPRPTGVAGGFIGDLTRSRSELLAENAVLRQQLIIAARSVARPKARSAERGLLVLLARLVPHWRNALLLVKPATLLRWHRFGFRLFWRWRSRSRRPPQPAPPIALDIVDLIQRMGRENRFWGSERVRGELLKLGIRVAKRTIQKCLRDSRPPGPRPGQSWATFLRNHTVWACDFLQTFDVWFRPIFAFFVIDVNAKMVVHVGVTRNPSQQWTAQQMREATPFGTGPRFVLRDNDDKYSFDRVAKGVGVRVLRTAVRAPLMNAACERFIGSVRRECLDHVIILGERHLLHVLREYALRYFNEARPHQGLRQRVPVGGARTLVGRGARVVAIPLLGGLHHDYVAAA
jgi:transposase InsO family protein